MVNVFDLEKNQTKPNQTEPNRTETEDTKNNLFVLLVILIIIQIGILSVFFTIRNYEENLQRVSKLTFYLKVPISNCKIIHFRLQD